MKVKPLGYDPKLGEKFLSEHDGLVLGFGRSSEQSSEQDSLSKYQSAQQAHDEQMPQVRSSEAPIETEEDAIRAEAIRRGSVRRMAADASRRFTDTASDASRVQPAPTRGSSR